MDIVAHTLWAVAGATVIHRRRPLSRSAVLVTLVLAALPDVIHLLPTQAGGSSPTEPLLPCGDMPWRYPDRNPF
jgi:hypothetical protein